MCLQFELNLKSHRLQNQFPAHENSINPGFQLKQPKPFSTPSRDIFHASESSHGAKPVHEQATNIIDDIRKTINQAKVVDNDQILSTAESRTDSKGLIEASRKPALAALPSKYYSPPFLEPIYNREYTDDPENNKVARTPADGQIPRRTFPTTTKSPHDKYDFSAFDSILKAVRKANREDYDFSKYIRNKDGTLSPRRTTQSKVVSKNSGFQVTTKKNTLFSATPAPVRPTQPKQVQNRASFNNQVPTIQSPSGFGLGQVQTTFLPTTTQRTTRTQTTPTRTTTRRPTTTRRTTTRRTTTTQRTTISTTARTPIVRPQLSAISAPALEIAPPIQEPRPFAQIIKNKVSSNNNPSDSSDVSPVIPPLALELLPPFEKEVYHDVATTLGPPIYYEWKSQVPASELLPPFENNDADPADNFGAHSQATRSVSGTNTILVESALEKLIKSNWTELRNIHSIPEFNFPLEREELRTGYDNNERVNSFQLKIPQKSALKGKEWYGENSKCPECHPSFLKPGLCSPCIKIRE